MIINESLLVAVHAQPVAVVTEIEPLPPRVPYVADVGLRESVHPFAWVTVNGCPATVSWPVRCGPVLAVMV